MAEIESQPDQRAADAPLGLHPAVAPTCHVRTSPFWRALPAGMRRRWWVFRPLDLIARHWPVFRRRTGLLVVRMDGIGDMALFRGALDHYADAFGVDPTEITVLGCTSWQSLGDVVFAGYRFHAIDEHAYARQPLYRFRISLFVRLLAPAVAICDSYLRRALMADSLVWVSGAPRTIVSRPFVNEATRVLFKYYLSQMTEIVDTGDYPTHEIIRHFRFVSWVAGREIPPEPPRLPWRDAAPPVPPGAPYVVINPGSNEMGRRWPIENYRSLATRLLAQGYRVVFVGLEEERREEDPIGPLAGTAGAIDLTGRTTLPRLMDLMNHAALVVTNDTGPAHLGIGLGTPTVVVIGGGHFGCFGPYPAAVAPNHVRFLFEKMGCYHCFWRCHKRAHKGEVFPCVGSVDAERVWRTVEELLADTAADRRRAINQ